MGKFPHLMLILVCVIRTIKCENLNPPLLEGYLHLINVDTVNNVVNEPRDAEFMFKEYDFIVVGAGTAGCVVANRLSEVPNWKVLLIEAGREEYFLYDIPLMANIWQLSPINWKYKTEPSGSSCLAMKNKQCHWPRGKVMGGSSVLNYMIYTRGNKKDYDQWETLGNKGWGWREVLPYFKKVENFHVREFRNDKQFHGTSGYLSITDVPYKTPIAKAFVEGARELGQPTIDYNGKNQIGFNYIQASMYNGTRWSSSKAYLHSVNRRPNLHVKKYSTVTKIIIDPETKTAVGVEFYRNNRKYFVRAKKEVIISAGAINSPQLLMLSGIGPKNHLREKQIKVIQNAKVGYNLQDHTATGALTYLIDQPYSINLERLVNEIKNVRDYMSFHEGPFSIPGGCEALGFVDVKNKNSSHPNIELLLVSGSLTAHPSLVRNFNLDEKLYKDMFGPIENMNSFMILPLTLRPKSAGRIMLRDNNPFHYPLIYPNYFSDPEGYDVKMAVAGIRMANELVKTTPFKKFNTRLYEKPLPSCQHLEYDTYKYWECYARHFTFTIYHHVGTCKMGPAKDRYAVVNERLKVRGIQNLRVIDASIMPTVPAAHTNAPTYMIAEKGSDMIKEDWGIKIDQVS